MAIKEIKKKNGETVYRTQIYLGIDSLTGKKVKASVTAKTKKELKRKELQRRLEFEKNGSTVKRNVQVQFYHELVELWLDNYKNSVRESTFHTTSTMIKYHLLPVFGMYKLDKITPPLIQRVVQEWGDNYNNNKLNAIADFRRLHTLNKKILGFGVVMGVLKNNPANDIMVPRKNDKYSKKKFLELDEVKRLQVVNEHYLINAQTFGNYTSAVLIKFLLATGLRCGEAHALTWDDIDLNEGTVTVNKTTSFNYSVNEPKTKAGYRTISFDKQTLRTLRIYKVRQEQFFKVEGMDFKNLVFSKTHFSGGYRTNTTDNKFFRKLLSECGIDDCTLHALRHTHATLMVSSGMPVKELQYRMGHGNVKMTLGLYSHFLQEKEKDSVSYFEKAISSL